MNTTNDLIDEFIKNIDWEDVPLEYIKSMIITDQDDMRHTLTGEKMQEFIAHPDRYQVKEARIVLNVYKMKRVVLGELADIYDELSRCYHKRHQ
jgi:hypothetical protein